MKFNEPSRTAFMVARQRAAHQLLDHGAILDDPHAVRILGEDEDTILQAFDSRPMATIGRLFTAARSRIAEDALTKAVARGVQQIVILGAGLDTFALRNPHASRIRIFEVDHPATQAWKRRRLDESQLVPPRWLTFVPVDFEQDDLQQKLSGAGFQPTSTAFFTWLGVVPYLTKNAIADTLNYIASIPDSEVVFDYAEPPESWSEDMKAMAAARMAQLEKIGEQSVVRLDPPAVAAILRSYGFCDMQDISFEQIVFRFGRHVQGLASGNAGLHVIHAKH